MRWGGGRWDGEGDVMGRRELDGNCDGEEVFEILLYNPVSPSPIHCVCGCVYFGRASYYSSCVLIRCTHN